MKRTISARSAAVAATVALAVSAPGTALGATGDEPEIVTGTYSVGTETVWRDLPDVTLGTAHGADGDVTVVADPSVARQSYEGIGMSLDETSVSNLWKLSEEERQEAIRALVDPDNGAGMDLFRVVIGTADAIEHRPFVSLDELPDGVEEDWDLDHFSIQHDLDRHIIEAAQLILQYNPDARFYASAWSAPAWMKTNNQYLGEVALIPGTSQYKQVGALREDCVDVFAQYYARFVQAYAEHGIDIDALTVLNEPGMDVQYPAMDIPIPLQQKLILSMRETLDDQGFGDVQIWAHDFNYWDWKDPASTETKNYYRIFKDSEDGEVAGADVLAATDAVAFHPYWGTPSVMADTTQQTGLPVHVTETQASGAGSVIDALRNDASSYTLWVQVTDERGGTLHWTDSREPDVDWEQVGATASWPNRLVTVDRATGTATYSPDLSSIGQFGRHLRLGDVRVESTGTQGGVSNAVFTDGDGHFTAILSNGNDTSVRASVVVASRAFTQTLPAGSTSTFEWDQELLAGENTPPTLSPVEDLTVDQYSTQTFTLDAADADGDVLTYYGLDLPDGVSVDPATGVVTVAPMVSGTFTPRFIVTDGRASAQATMTLTVTAMPVPVGLRIEAEHFVEATGWTEGSGPVEANAQASGGANIGWVSGGKTLSYEIDVPVAGVHRLELRLANGRGETVTGAITVLDEDGQVLATVDSEPTGGWASYASTFTEVELPAGVQTITLALHDWGFNLDYLQLTGPASPSPSPSPTDTAAGPSVSPSASPSVSSSVSPSVTPSSPGPSLADTGSGVGWIAVGALGLLVVGSLVSARARRADIVGRGRS